MNGLMKRVGDTPNPARLQLEIDPASSAAKTPREPGAPIIQGPERPEQARTLDLATLVAKGLKADVPQRRQRIDSASGAREGTCGLFALGMVQDFWHAKDPAAHTALVKSADADGPGLHFNHPPTDREPLFDYAQRAGFSATGEIFTASHLGEIAERYGYTARVHEGGELDALYRVLDAGHPALVCFDVDPNGDPHEVGGDHAHWGVITGYLDLDGERFLIAKHGWDVAEHHVWPAADFARSWNNLESTDYYGTPGDGALPNGAPEPGRVQLPAAGEGRADISAALAGKIVEVVPAGVRPVGGRPV